MHWLYRKFDMKKSIQAVIFGLAGLLTATVPQTLLAQHVTGVLGLPSTFVGVIPAPNSGSGASGFGLAI